MRFSARLSFLQPKNASVSPFGLFTDRNGRYSYPFIYFIFLSPRGVIFTPARVSLALLSLRKNGELLVVYQRVKSPNIHIPEA